MKKSTLFLLWTLYLGVQLTSACQPLAAPVESKPITSTAPQPTLIVATHSSFAISEALLQQFEQENQVKVQVLKMGDVGESLNRLLLSKDAPLADLFYGVDNTFFSRAIKGGIFERYDTPALANIAEGLNLDAENRLLPVDVGYVSLNADKKWFSDKGLALPQTLEELTQPAYKGLLVIENPATSSPGLAFLLATIQHFGEDQYLDFWQQLKQNDLLVVNDWSEAYFSHFSVGSGGSGDRPLVVSYTSSPPADVTYATDGRTEPASVNLNLAGGVFRQIEFVGILKGTKQRALAEKWVDFMLSQPFQEDMPLQMYVYPANQQAELPKLFSQFAEVPDDVAIVDPALIDAKRETWIEAWTNAVLR